MPAGLGVEYWYGVVTLAIGGLQASPLSRLPNDRFAVVGAVVITRYVCLFRLKSHASNAGWQSASQQVVVAALIGYKDAKMREWSVLGTCDGCIARWIRLYVIKSTEAFTTQHA